MGERYFNGMKIIVRQDEDGDWIAFFQNKPDLSAFGDAENEAIEELKKAWKVFKESLKGNEIS